MSFRSRLVSVAVSVSVVAVNVVASFPPLA